MEKKENRNSYSELPKGEEPSPAKTPKNEPRKSKESRKIRILKKSKSIKERNDPSRFSGEGINFSAKIIGIEDVFDARGNRMCQEALQKLKVAVKTSGDHKQKIILNISLNGITIKDEKSGEVLHHHPIHKISCISQDTKDNRAFGFVYGCPKTGHRFFAIKTEKAASQVVMTLRDLFLVALEIKKKEIENAVEKEELPPATPKPLNGLSNGVEPDLEKQEVQKFNDSLLYSNTVLLPKEEEEIPVSSEECCASASVEEVNAMDALLDLQSEVSILQKGICQMDHSIAHTVSQNLGVSFSEDEISEASTSSIPTSFQFKMDKLSSLYQETMSISSRSSSTSDYNAPENKQEENDTPKKDPPRDSTTPAISEAASSSSLACSASETANADSVEDRYAVFLDIDSLPSIFENPSLVKILPAVENDLDLLGATPAAEIQETEVVEKKCATSPSAAFAELDPLGNQPFVDKKDFFQDVRTPPKKILKDLAGGGGAFESFSDGDVVTYSHECPAFRDLKLNHPEGSLTMPTTQPPKLPPKRNVVSPLSSISSELFSESDSCTNGVWEPKNPFNPFLNESYPDLPPPTSPPPPPPPPRLPIKATPESSPSMSPPPPRPPICTNGVPTPPLPKRKVPLGSSSRTWFSFDQEAVAYSAPLSSNDYAAPPLPSPARKLPPTSPLLKSSSASNSPATARRLFNRSPFLDTHLAPVIKENSDDDCSYVENETLKENNREPKPTISTSSPRKLLSRHSSMAQDGVTFNPFLDSSQQNRHESCCSPPLPPKPVSFSLPKPYSVARVDSLPCTTSSSSSASAATESSNGAHSSSSLAFSSANESKRGSSSEALFSSNSTSSQSDVFMQSSSGSEETVRPQSSIGTTNEGNALSPDVSPDSIFRRKSDPFADDFFLSLHRKPNGNSKSSAVLEDPFSNVKS